MNYPLVELVIMALLSAPAASSGTGASEFFTSTEANVTQARQLVQDGAFSDAEKLLQGCEKTSKACSEGLEVIRRLRRDYSSSEADLLAKVAPSIPDVKAADLQRWLAAGQVQARKIDGQVWYFRREPANLFRFCPEAIERRGHARSKVPAGPDSKKLVNYLQTVVDAAAHTDSPIVLPVKHRVTFRLTVQPDRPGAKPGSVVRCWLPLPQEYRQQTAVKLIRTDPAEHQITPSALSDSKIAPNAQRTVYLERTIENPKAPLVFEEQFEFTCAAYYPKLSDAQAKPLTRTDLGEYLSERAPHIRFSPEIRAAVEKAIGDEQNPLAKVRKIYHAIGESVRYCAEEEYGIIPGFSQKAVTSKKGDCGIQSILFITMCRAAGIPARWQSGWESKPWSWDMHDWAEFYVEPWGWLPADMSYGLQPSDNPAIREFYIGHLDAYRMIVNLDYGCPLVPPKTSFRSEPADFQRGEVEIDGRNLYFDEWDYDIQFQWEPVGK